LLLGAFDNNNNDNDNNNNNNNNKKKKKKKENTNKREDMSYANNKNQYFMVSNKTCSKNCSTCFGFLSSFEICCTSKWWWQTYLFSPLAPGLGNDPI